jgi:hypothetical protein
MKGILTLRKDDVKSLTPSGQLVLAVEGAIAIRIGSQRARVSHAAVMPYAYNLYK